MYVVGDCASLPHAPSAQLAEGQAEQIVQVLLKRWKGEALPETLPAIKLKGMLGSLGKKHGFGMLAEKPVTGTSCPFIEIGSTLDVQDTTGGRRKKSAIFADFFALGCRSRPDNLILYCA